MNTTISVSRETRDHVARIAAELGVSSMSEALKVVLFRYESAQAMARLEAEPEAMTAYIGDGKAFTDLATSPIEDWDWT
ncbi:MAG TPA: hypothetical protein VK059_13500 [Nocardioidaceae bacterium]|nr:hypothetical protein [Nocardioidaceae bacterium]